MTTLALEIHDAGLQAARSDRLLTPSPGYAWLAEDRIRFGVEALARERLQPRRIQHHHWDRLDSEPLARVHPAAKTHADLVHGHLNALLEEAGEGVQELALVVPGSLDRQQLGLLLGIAAASAPPVIGMVDTAVVACSELAIRGPAVHVDLHLHRAVVTHLEIDAAAVWRVGVETSVGAGRVGFFRALADEVARTFVERTRFDPLHDAASEQALFDALPGCLEALREESAATIELGSGDARYRVEVTRQDLGSEIEAGLAPLLTQIAASRASRDTKAVVLSSTAASLPGFGSRLASHLGGALHVLAPGDPARLCLAALPRLRSAPERIEWVTRLARGGESGGA